MAYQVNGGSLMEVLLYGDINNQVCISTFHYKYVGTLTLFDAGQILDAMASAIQQPGALYQRWRDCLSNEMINLRIQAQWVWPIRYRSRVYTPANDNGGKAEAAFPQNVAVAITRRGETADRGSVGTLHMPAVPESAIQMGLVMMGGIAAPYGDLANELPKHIILGGGGAEFAPVLYKRSNPANSVLIDAAFVQTTGRVERRRTVGLGA